MPDVIEEEKVVIHGNQQRLVTEKTTVVESTHPCPQVSQTKEINLLSV
jgi:glycerate-2-kinase